VCCSILQCVAARCSALQCALGDKTQFLSTLGDKTQFLSTHFCHGRHVTPVFPGGITETLNEDMQVNTRLLQDFYHFNDMFGALLICMGLFM